MTMGSANHRIAEAQRSEKYAESDLNTVRSILFSHVRHSKMARGRQSRTITRADTIESRSRVPQTVCLTRTAAKTNKNDSRTSIITPGTR
jgi:hypothetical protein